MTVTFEGYERRADKINKCLADNGIASLEEALQICTDKGFNRVRSSTTPSPSPSRTPSGPTPSVALSLSSVAPSPLLRLPPSSARASRPSPFPAPSPRTVRSVWATATWRYAALRRHRVLRLPGRHESFAAAEGAIGLALNANKARKKPLRVILNGLGKDAAQIIARINGFTYVKTQFDYYTGELKVIETIPYSDGPRAAVNCYGSDDVREGVAIMWHENVDISITGNSTNPTRFQHPVAGTYKKERIEAGKKYFSVASGGGTGRTLHPDNMGAGPASYGMTDTMGRMHSDAQFAGSSSVPAHVDMMGLIGMGNNPMVGATVACAVAVEEALKA